MESDSHAKAEHAYKAGTKNPYKTPIVKMYGNIEQLTQTASHWTHHSDGAQHWMNKTT